MTVSLVVILFEVRTEVACPAGPIIKLIPLQLGSGTVDWCFVPRLANHVGGHD